MQPEAMAFAERVLRLRRPALLEQGLGLKFESIRDLKFHEFLICTNKLVQF